MVYLFFRVEITVPMRIFINIKVFVALIFLMSCCISGPKYPVFDKVKIYKGTKFDLLHGDGIPTEIERHRGDFVILDTVLQRSLVETWQWSENRIHHSCGNSYDIFIIWGESQRKV